MKVAELDGIAGRLNAPTAEGRRSLRSAKQPRRHENVNLVDLAKIEKIAQQPAAPLYEQIRHPSPTELRQQLVKPLRVRRTR